MSRVPVDRLGGWEFFDEDPEYNRDDVERGDWYPRAEADAIETLIAAINDRGLASSAARKACIKLWELRDAAAVARDASGGGDS